MAHHKGHTNKEATTIANTKYEKPILEHGTPEVLLSNNGKEFTNDTLAYVCQEFNIEQNFTSPYTSRSNGKTESFNKPPSGNCTRRIQGHGIRSWTRSYSFIGTALTHPWKRHPIPFTTTGIHHYQYRN